jgi:hypothetical protein
MRLPCQLKPSDGIVERKPDSRVLHCSAGRLLNLVTDSLPSQELNLEVRGWYKACTVKQALVQCFAHLPTIVFAAGVRVRFFQRRRFEDLQVLLREGVIP